MQLVYGWNNQALQNKASGVTFTYDASETYDVTIEFDTGNPDRPRSIQHHTATQNKSTTVNSSIAYEPRTRNQITGFNLLGLGSTSTSGDQIPQVGDSCPNGNVGTCVVTDVQLASSTGGLYVHYPEGSFLIWSSPAAPVV
ncbi:MAG: hypothetical protein M3283_09585 [Actinomycetota bacterium]|nr:hypothetical protein [Actinomycetota bacterium]